MRLESPLWLLLLVPALAALWAAWRYGEPNRAALSFPPTGALRHSLTRASILLRAVPYILKGAALILAVIAMARPQTVQRDAGGFSQGIDIMLALDTSTSMRALDFNPKDRITAAKETAQRFIESRLSDRIGILIFAGVPMLTCPLTLDYPALTEYLSQVSAGMTGTDGTAIGDAIAAAVNHLKSSRARSRVIILLTDGRSNMGSIDPMTAAQAAKSFDIKIYTIGTGKRGDSVVPIQTPMGTVLQPIQEDIDEDALLKIAALTDGKYFRATSYKELEQIYRDIDQLERNEEKRPPVVSYTDLHGWLLVPAAPLLAMQLLLSRTALMRVP